jgi:hypothetical protein
MLTYQNVGNIVWKESLPVQHIGQKLCCIRCWDLLIVGVFKILETKESVSISRQLPLLQNKYRTGG